MNNKIKEALQYVIILLVVILLKSFVVTTIRVNGNSMYDTLENKDIMILDKISYRFQKIQRFDIVVVRREKDRIIKRVIALPGEEIAYVDNVLYINGEKIEDCYNRVEQENFSVVLEDDEYFVMGDNRVDSLDSRYIGPIKEDRIEGHAIFTIFPFSKWGQAK